MRKRTVLLCTTVLALAWAGSASALSIDPDPVNHQRDGGATLNADVALVASDTDTLTFQLSVTTGSITRIDVSMLFDSLTLPSAFSYVSAVGTNTGTGDVGFVSAVSAVTEGEFFVNGTVDAGETSDEFWVQFDAPIQLTWEGAITFDNGLALDESYVITPEPGTLALTGLGMGILLLARRRRA